MNRLEFQRLATERLEDASALLQAGRYSGAYYLAGYAVECALKACIARQIKEHDFPPPDAARFYTHDLDTLLKLAGLESKILGERSSNPALDENWEIVTEWKQESRYRSSEPAATARLINGISDSVNGVLQYLRKDW